MSVRDNAFEYIAWLEAHAAELEVLSAQKTIEIARLASITASSNGVHIEATPIQNINGVKQEEEKAKELARQEKLARIRENVARAEKERDEREKNAQRQTGSGSSSVADTEAKWKEAERQAKLAKIRENVAKADAERKDRERIANEKAGDIPKASSKTTPKASSSSESSKQKKGLGLSVENAAGESVGLPSKPRRENSTTLEAKLPEGTAGGSQEEEKSSAEVANPITPVSPSSSSPPPPPGFGAIQQSLASPQMSPPPEEPLKGTLVVFESGIKSGTAYGEALVSASLSKRDMYTVIEDGGRVVHRFEGTDSAKFTVAGLKPGSQTVLLVETSQGARVPDCSVLINIPAIPPPSPPRSLAVVDRQKTSVRIKWLNPAENGGSRILSYEVEISETDIPASFEKIYDGPKPECTLARLALGTTYFVRVRAVSALGASPFTSPSFAVTTMAAPPAAPSPVRLVSEQGSSMMVAWDPPEKTNGSEVSGYQLEMCKLSSAAESEAFQVVYNDSHHDRVAVKNLDENATYKFRVRAENSQGYSPWSSVSELQTGAALPGRIPSAPRIMDGNKKEIDSIAHASPFVVSWEPSTVGGKNATYHLEARKENTTQWETVYLGSLCNVRLQCDGTEIYNGFAPGTRHELAVSASNDRGLGPRSASARIQIKSVPPSPPLTAPKVKCCSIEKGTMIIGFDPSPNSGGSPQVASVIEIRPRLQVDETSVSSQKSPSTRSTRFFESVAEHQQFLESSKPKSKAISLGKFKVGDAVDAIYHLDGRFYHAEVKEVIFPNVDQGEQEYTYKVRFSGYENTEIVKESNIRMMFKKGDDVTAVLYDTTAGAHAAGSSFVVKENVRRLVGEIVSSIEEGYFVKFKGRGVATQKTNAFDVFGIVKPSESMAVATTMERTRKEEDRNTDNVVTTVDLPRNLSAREWFEACETADLECALKGLKPGAEYEIRIAAASVGGGRGNFGPVHVVRMDPGLPQKPDFPPEIVSMKPNGKVEMILRSPMNDGGATVMSAQVQFVEVKVLEEDMVLINKKDYQSTGQAATFEAPSYDSTTYSYQHLQAGVDLALRYRVKTKVGWSDWSEPALARLPPAPPSGVSDVRVQVSKNGNALHVAFKAPAKSNGAMVESYVVQYRKILSLRQKTPDAWQAITFPANSKSLVATTEFPVNVVPGALYEFKIQATNAVGTGATVSTDFRIPCQSPSAIPHSVRITPKSHREFEASWDFSDQDELACGGEPVTYETEFVPAVGKGAPPVGELSKDVVNAGTTPVKYFNKNSKVLLKPEKSYWFRVRAVNTKGSSPFSQWVSFVMPSAPREAEFVSQLVVERISVRETSTSADLAVRLVMDVLTGDGVDALAKSSGGPIGIRVEVQERGSSVVAAVLEQRLPSKSSAATNNDVTGWREVVLTTGTLKPNSSYVCRAQLVKGGISGELSKATGFTTRPAPHQQAEVQKDEKEDESAVPQQPESRLSQSMIRNIVRRQTSSAAVGSGAAGNSQVLIELIRYILSDHAGLLAMFIVWIILSRSLLLLLLQLMYFYAMWKFVPSLTEEDVHRAHKLEMLAEDLKVQQRRLQDMEQKAGTDKKRLKDVKTKQKQLQHSQLEYKQLEAEVSRCKSDVMSLGRLPEKRGLIRVSVPVLYCLGIITTDLLEDSFQLYGLGLEAFIAALSVVVFVIPRKV